MADARKWLNDNARGMTKKEAIKTCAKDCGLSEDYIRRLWNQIIGFESTKSKPNSGGVKSGMTLSDFSSQFDYEGKIKKAISNYLVGTDNIKEDREMCELSGVPIQLWRKNSDNMQFNKYKLMVREKYKWADASTIIKMKKILIKGGHNVAEQ
jgi:hypothetical protein